MTSTKKQVREIFSWTNTLVVSILIIRQKKKNPEFNSAKINGRRSVKFQNEVWGGGQVRGVGQHDEVYVVVIKS